MWPVRFFFIHRKSFDKTKITQDTIVYRTQIHHISSRTSPLLLSFLFVFPIMRHISSLYLTLILFHDCRNYNQNAINLKAEKWVGPKNLTKWQLKRGRGGILAALSTG